MLRGKTTIAQSTILLKPVVFNLKDTSELETLLSEDTGGHNPQMGKKNSGQFLGYGMDNPQMRMGDREKWCWYERNG